MEALPQVIGTRASGDDVGAKGGERRREPLSALSEADRHRLWRLLGDQAGDMLDESQP